MGTQQSTPPQENLEFPKYPKLQEANEVSVLWDEYKYRHDLIWRYLIRSTLALIALVTVRYSTVFNPTVLLVLIAWLVALGYWVVTLIVVEAELRLYKNVKTLHRERQRHYFGLHTKVAQTYDTITWGKIFFVDNFSRRVGIYLLILLIVTLLAGPIALFDPGPKMM